MARCMALVTDVINVVVSSLQLRDQSARFDLCSSQYGIGVLQPKFPSTRFLKV